MALYQKRRGPNGTVEFFVDNRKVDVNEYVNASGGKENLFTALSDSQNLKQLQVLSQSLAQHNTPDAKKAISRIQTKINTLTDIQESRKRETEAFDALGIPAELREGMTESERRMWVTMGYEKLKAIEEANPIIDPLSEQNLKKIREKVANDPGIKKHERDSVNRLVETTRKRVASMQFESDQFGEQFESEAEKNRDLISRNAEATGTAFSPVRQQQVEELEGQEQGIIASFAQRQEEQLRGLGRSLEDMVGTEKTMGQFGNILTLNNTLTSDSVKYNPSSVQTTYQDSRLGREVGQLQRNQEAIEIERVESLAGIR